MLPSRAEDGCETYLTIYRMGRKREAETPCRIEPGKGKALEALEQGEGKILVLVMGKLVPKNLKFD